MATSPASRSIIGPPLCFPRPGPVPFDTLRSFPRHIPFCPPPFPPPFPQPTEKPVLASATIGGFIERMWAYKTIKKMLKQSKLVDAKKESEGKKDRALELSLKYGFVSELTSMVVVPPNQGNGTEKAEEKAETLNTEDEAPADAAFSAKRYKFSAGAAFFGSGGAGAPAPGRHARPMGGPAGPTGFSGIGGLLGPPPPWPSFRPATFLMTTTTRTTSGPPPTTTTQSPASKQIDLYIILDEVKTRQLFDNLLLITGVITELKAKHGENSVRVSVVQLEAANKNATLTHKLSDRQDPFLITKAILTMKSFSGPRESPDEGRDILDSIINNKNIEKYGLFFTAPNGEVWSNLREIRDNLKKLMIIPAKDMPDKELAKFDSLLQKGKCEIVKADVSSVVSMID